MKYLVASAVVLIGVLVPATLFPQEQSDKKLHISLDVTRVNVICTVADRGGHFVTTLTKDQFEIFDDKRPQQILDFTAESGLPLRVALLVDSSNSVRDRFKFIQESAVKFLESAIRPHQDKAVIVSFDTATQVASEFMDDPVALSQAIRDLRPGGGTSLYDAIVFSCREKLGREEPRHEFRRAIVVLSDGDDTESRATRDQALEAAQKADSVIYAVSTNSDPVETYGDKVLKYLTSETGGQAFFPFRLQDLSRSFENVANELRHQYSLLYRPEPLKTDGRYHTIEIRVKDRKNVSVRARKGYYAPKL